MSLVREEFKYDEEQHAHMEREGFVVLRAVLSREGVEVGRKEIDCIWNELHDDVDKGWIMNVHQLLPRNMNWIWDIATHPAVISAMQRQLGEDVIFYSSQVYNKPEHDGTEAGGEHVPWHQDGNVLRTVWVAFDDISTENGGLRVLGGWHTKGRLKTGFIQYNEQLATESTSGEQDRRGWRRDAGIGWLVLPFCCTTSARRPTPAAVQWDQYGYSAQEAMEQSVAYELAAGDVGIHHARTPHCSARNECKTRSRRVLILRYMPASEPPKQNNWHHHYKDGNHFLKREYVVCGHDEHGRSRTPFEEELVVKDFPKSSSPDQ